MNEPSSTSGTSSNTSRPAEAVLQEAAKALKPQEGRKKYTLGSTARILATLTGTRNYEINKVESFVGQLTNPIKQDRKQTNLNETLILTKNRASQLEDSRTDNIRDLGASFLKKIKEELEPEALKAIDDRKTLEQAIKQFIPEKDEAMIEIHKAITDNQPTAIIAKMKERILQKQTLLAAQDEELKKREERIEQALSKIAAKTDVHAADIPSAGRRFTPE